MFLTEYLLTDRQHAQVERLGLGKSTVRQLHDRQSVQRSCELGAVRTGELFAHRQGLLVQRLGLLQRTADAVEDGERQQRRSSIRMLTQRLLPDLQGTLGGGNPSFII